MPNASLYEDYASFQDFRTDGYVVVNNFLSRTELKVLRQVQILVRQLCKAQQVQSHNHLQGALYRSAMFWSSMRLSIWQYKVLHSLDGK